MTKSEFNDWLTGYHDAAFCGFAKWFKSGLLDAQKARMDIWFTRLGKHEKDDLMEASFALTQVESRPFGDHLNWLDSRCRQQAAEVIRGPVNVRRCEMCDGFGMVSVEYLVQTVTAGGNIQPPGWMDGSAYCKCTTGQDMRAKCIASWKRKGNENQKIMATYNASQMRLCKGRFDGKTVETFLAGAGKIEP